MHDADMKNDFGIRLLYSFSELGHNILLKHILSSALRDRPDFKITRVGNEAPCVECDF